MFPRSKETIFSLQYIGEKNQQQAVYDQYEPITTPEKEFPASSDKYLPHAN